MLDKLFYYIINCAKTNRKNGGRDTATAVAIYSGHGYVKKKKKKEHSDTRKTTALLQIHSTA